VALLAQQLQAQHLFTQQQPQFAVQDGGQFVPPPPVAGGEDGGEPIYQNQGQIYLADPTIEPIYQNLPIQPSQSEEEIRIDETVEGLHHSSTREDAINVDASPPRLVLRTASPVRDNRRTELVRDERETVSPPRVLLRTTSPVRDDRNSPVRDDRIISPLRDEERTAEHSGTPKLGRNIRTAVTLSREDLKSAGGEETDSAVLTVPRRKLEMRQYLEPAVRNSVAATDQSLISSVNTFNNNLQESSKSNTMSPLSTLSPGDMLSPASNLHTSKSKSTDALSILAGTLKKKSSSTSSTTLDESKESSTSRPKGRKRWGLTMAGKSGSLKSTKSDGSGRSGGEESRNSSGRGGGGMSGMLANLHGLTRSRPDLLVEALPTEFKSPAKLPKESIGPFLETKLLEGDVVREFEQIPKKKSTGCNTTVAHLAENEERNRFLDVVPYDENRVRINNEKDNKYGYINASHISATVGSSQRFYVAGQGPLPSTVHNFWSMVHSSDVHLIVMLTDVSGASKSSACIPYWPGNNGSSLEVGEFTITKISGTDNGGYVTTTLHLTHTKSRRRRRIWHIQYTDWSEQGLPRDVDYFLHFMQEISALRSLSAGEIPAGNNRNPPVLVHCSAGVGRTGVVILCDILLYSLDHNLDVDIPKVLTHLRQQRMMMVQTLAQYKFIHTVLIQHLGSSRLI